MNKLEYIEKQIINLTGAKLIDDRAHESKSLQKKVKERMDTKT